MSELMKEFIELAKAEGMNYTILNDNKVVTHVNDGNCVRSIFVEYNDDDPYGNLRFYEKPRFGSPKGIMDYLQQQKES